MKNLSYTALIISVFLFLFAGCREKTIDIDTESPDDPSNKLPPEIYTPITEGWDFTKGDIFVRTDTLTATGKGLNHVVVESEGAPLLLTKGTGIAGSQALKCLATQGKSNRYIYFNIDKLVLGNMPPGYGTMGKDAYNVDVVVEYFDSGTDTLTLQYHGLDETIKKPGYWPESRYCVKTNTNKWKRFVFHFIRASFSDGIKGCDIRIDNHGDGDEYIGSISVLKPRLYIDMLNYTTFHGNQSATAYDHIEGARLGIRNDLNWRTVEPSQDNWRWTSIDQFINLLGSRGLFSIPILCYNAPWSAGPGSNQKTAVKTDTNRRDYGDYVFHVVERYKDKVKCWEIWNEPMSGGFWEDGTATDYVRMLAVAYQRAKEADPTCFIISGGMVSIKLAKYNYEPFPSLEEAVNSGLNWSCNGWGLHSNDGKQKPENAITNHISLKEIVDAVCVIPTCQTENAVGISDPDVTNRGKLTVKHNILQRAKIGELSYGIFPKATWTESDGITTHYGLLDEDGNKRDPYFTEIKVWAERMRRTLFNADLTTAGRSDADHAYEFKVMQADESGAWVNGSAPTGTVIVLWNSSTTVRNVYINGLASAVNYCNLDGSGQSVLTPSSGKINIGSLGDSPKYIWY